MIINVLMKVIFYSVLLGFVVWYWGEANETTKTGLFFFVFLIAFSQNVYYSHKLSKLEAHDQDA